MGYKTKELHLSVLRTFRISRFESGNLKRVYLCNPFRPRCWILVLPFSVHSKFKVARCLLILHSVIFAFPWLIRIMGLETTTLQFGSCFKVLNFSMSRSFMIFLDVLVVASLVPMWRIKWLGCALGGDSYRWFLHPKSKIL